MRKPDERRDFFMWSVERFDDRCFVNFLTGSAAGIGRQEISRAEFDAAMLGNRRLRDFVSRADQCDPIIVNTPEWAKIAVFLTALGSVAIVVVKASL